jgi:hypothetical protein
MELFGFWFEVKSLLLMNVVYIDSLLTDLERKHPENGGWFFLVGWIVATEKLY